MIIETEFVSRSKQWSYKWLSRLCSYLGATATEKPKLTINDLSLVHDFVAQLIRALHL